MALCPRDKVCCDKIGELSYRSPPFQPMQFGIFFDFWTDSLQCLGSGQQAVSMCSTMCSLYLSPALFFPSPEPVLTCSTSWWLVWGWKRMVHTPSLGLLHSNSHITLFSVPESFPGLPHQLFNKAPWTNHCSQQLLMYLVPTSSANITSSLVILKL